MLPCPGGEGARRLKGLNFNKFARGRRKWAGVGQWGSAQEGGWYLNEVLHLRSLY